MKWLLREDFWKHFEKIQPGEDIDYDGWCYFEISEKDLRSKIGSMEPNKDLEGEDNPPGPVSRWYGDLSGTPVILDFHHHHPNGEAVTIYHGRNTDSRAKIRSEFEDWGNKWDESKAS